MSRLAETVHSQSDGERLRFLVDGVKDLAVFILDTKGKVATWNAGAERLCGYRADEIVGADLARFYPPEGIEAGNPAQALAIADTAGPFEEEAWRVRKDGSRFWARVVITALRDPVGGLIGYGNTTRDMTEQRRAAELEATLKEREALLLEVHHRVKNNLQVVSSLINMQMRSLGDDASRDAFLECQARVQAMALIHEKLYQSKDFARVPFAEYMRSLAGNIFHATGVSPEGITLELAIENVALAVDRAIPCGLILNELMTNALKHAFPNGRSGTIRVELGWASGGALRLVVGDDGVGLPQEVDVRDTPSLGLHLVRMLARQLDATLEVEATRGTSFRVTIPVEP